jgi:general secretion pathway protein H
MSGSTTSTHGFTLIELIVVLLLIVLMLGLSAVFMAGRLPSTTIDAAGREICAIIRHARSAAVMEGEDKSVIVDLDAQNISLQGSGYRYLPEDVHILAMDPFSGEIRTGRYLIRFNAYGGFEGGDLLLWNKKKAVKVQIDPVVGAVYLK